MPKKIVPLVGSLVFLAGLTATAMPAFAQWPYYSGYQRARPPFPSVESDDDQIQPPDDLYDSRPPAAYPRGAYSRTPDGYERNDYDLNVRSSQRTAALVPNPTEEGPGTIVIDTKSRQLYYIQPDGMAIRYGIGVGREGFAWKGTARVGRKAEWPRWIPPKEMLKRRPDLPTSMEGGVENPLGARALYLYQGERDTLFRIHGTNEPDTIGKAVSSGCIRMMNADVIDLFQRVPVGTRVVVL
ncbi:L,D-transpeptidase [Beijerinckia indica]|uniref:ErfK/YbiS/YcfS/YnhG family protein n=1 Tax=Beijerinckia indica subsp. indica (strain ATCC 9039 / DSM 1715 / NCIMB 8712) TaxID=395963 RepID=B2IBJ2_BEII9|nr:L,D-transpeptidase [Beijerinckia indica]ACB96618.1 ErfK/YbiS/YcfS/YnhG family protein [Beijerinckia indica subsp. indica ATCC 9039]